MVESFEGALLGNRYRIGHLLGRGAMGSVYEAIDETANRSDLAIKVLEGIDTNQADERRARFLREGSICRNLVSLHAVHVLDHGVDDEHGVPFLVMEKLAGFDLGSIILHALPLDPMIAACVAYQAAKGLSDAHAAGIVHRDVKPSNLFISCDESETCRVVVMDFGLAKVHEPLNALTRSGAFMGTALYIAPEQAINAKTASERSDVWSLGMTLYHLLTGVPAFAQAGSFMALVLEITGSGIRSAQDIAPWIPSGLTRAVHSLLLRDPAKRCPSMSELMLLLSSATGGSAATHCLRRGDFVPVSLSVRERKAEVATLPASFEDLLHT